MAETTERPIELMTSPDEQQTRKMAANMSNVSDIDSDVSSELSDYKSLETDTSTANEEPFNRMLPYRFEPPARQPRQNRPENLRRGKYRATPTFNSLTVVSP